MKELDCWKEEEFKEVYEKYFSLIFRISLLYLRKIEEAEDMVQEVLMNVLIEKEIIFLYSIHIVILIDSHAKIPPFTRNGNKNT